MLEKLDILQAICHKSQLNNKFYLVMRDLKKPLTEAADEHFV